MLSPRADLFLPLLDETRTTADRFLPNPGLLYAFASLANCAYKTADAQLDLWGEWAGYTDAQTILTPGTSTPNYVRCIHPDGCVFAFAGSTALEQLTRYLRGAVQGPTGIPTSALGMKLVNDFVRRKMLALKAHVLADLAGLPPTTKVCFTGHSLGGAIAAYMGYDFKKRELANVCNVVTFGRPKIGNFSLTSDLSVSVGEYRVIASGDVVPDLPPGSVVTIIGELIPIGYGLSYIESGMPWVIQTAPLRLVRTTAAKSQIVPMNLARLAFSLGHADFGAQAHSAITSHAMDAYVGALGIIAAEFNNLTGANLLHNLNKSLVLVPWDDNPDPAAPPAGTWVPEGTVYDYAQPGSPAPAPPTAMPNAHPPSPVVISHAAAVYSETGIGEGRLLPVGVRSTMPENVETGAMAAQVAAARTTRRWLFRGRDRRMILKLLKVMDAMVGRDWKVDFADRTSAISVREHMLDWSNVDEMVAFDNVYETLVYLAYLTVD